MCLEWLDLLRVFYRDLYELSVPQKGRTNRIHTNRGQTFKRFLALGTPAGGLLKFRRC